jgi:hypothetical protein
MCCTASFWCVIATVIMTPLTLPPPPLSLSLSHTYTHTHTHTHTHSHTLSHSSPCTPCTFVPPPVSTLRCGLTTAGPPVVGMHRSFFFLCQRTTKLANDGRLDTRVFWDWMTSLCQPELPKSTQVDGAVMPMRYLAETLFFFPSLLFVPVRLLPTGTSPPPNCCLQPGSKSCSHVVRLVCGPLSRPHPPCHGQQCRCRFRLPARLG